jgi:hypothetical protein
MLDNAITSLYELPPRSVREQLANLARIMGPLDEMVPGSRPRSLG